MTIGPISTPRHNLLCFQIGPFISLSPQNPDPLHLCQHNLFLLLIWLIEDLYIYLPTLWQFAVHSNQIFHFTLVLIHCSQFAVQPAMALPPLNLLLQGLLILSLKAAPLAWASHSDHPQLPRGDAGYQPGPVAREDIDWLEFPLNLEYLEAEFFLWASTGYGLDHIAPELVGGGPPPIGARKANLDKLVQDVILQFAFQEVGHLR